MKIYAILSIIVCCGLPFYMAYPRNCNGMSAPSVKNALISSTGPTTKERVDVANAHDEYMKTLLAAAEDPKLDEMQQLVYWVRLARMGNMQAFEHISRLTNEPGLGMLDWVESIEAARGDKTTVRKLLSDKHEDVRRSGVLLAGFLGMQDDLKKISEKENNPDVKRVIWWARGLAHDFTVVPTLVAVLSEKRSSDQDVTAAQDALGALLGENGQVTVDQFRKRLEGMIDATRTAASQPAQPSNGK